MLKCQIVNRHDHRGRAKRWSGVLDMEEVDRAEAKFEGERDRHTDQWSRRRQESDGKVGKPSSPFIRRASIGVINSISILNVDFGERFDQVLDVSFISTLPCSDGMGVDTDMHNSMRKRIGN